MKINQIDIRIIKILLRDARITFTDIGKECKISTELARIRYNNLKKNGVITGEIMQVLPEAIGIKCFGLIEIVTKKNMRKTIQEFLEKQPPIIASVSDYLENYINAYFALPNLENLQQITQNLKAQKGIVSIKTNLYSGFPFNEYPENLSITSLKENQKNTEIFAEILTRKEQAVIENKEVLLTNELKKMNKNTRTIAKKLANNARISISELAKQSNISYNQTKRIYQKLRKTFFGKSTITVNLSKLGYTAALQVIVKLESGYNVDVLCNKILGISNVIAISKILGKTNFVIAAPVKNFKELFYLRNQILAVKGVRRIESRTIQLIPSWPTNFFACLL